MSLYQITANVGGEIVTVSEFGARASEANRFAAMLQHQRGARSFTPLKVVRAFDSKVIFERATA